MAKWQIIVKTSEATKQTKDQNDNKKQTKQKQQQQNGRRGGCWKTNNVCNFACRWTANVYVVCLFLNKIEIIDNTGCVLCKARLGACAKSAKPGAHLHCPRCSRRRCLPSPPSRCWPGACCADSALSSGLQHHAGSQCIVLIKQHIHGGSQRMGLFTWPVSC